MVTPLKTLMGFSVHLNVQLKFYNLPFGKIYKESYVVKYARQFQYDWKIPDKEWWFTAEAAAKHPRVYPPVEEGTKEPTPKEGNKHG